MQLVFVHGWAFSPDIWLPIQQCLPQKSFINVDLGYFQHPATTLDFLPDNAVYIGHSLGVLWILDQVFEKISGLVSISGFDCFYRHVPSKNIALMNYGIKKNSDIQLASFYRQCGLKTKSSPPPHHTQTLLDGLDMLTNRDCSIRKENLLIPVLPLASMNDSIVPPEMTKKIWQDNKILWHENGGHILPLKQPEWCAYQINNFLKQF